LRRRGEENDEGREENRAKVDDVKVCWRARSWPVFRINWEIFLQGYDN